MYKVLVCDDEKDIVSAISIYLTSDGYEVIPARNGLEALDIVKHNDVPVSYTHLKSRKK